MSNWAEETRLLPSNPGRSQTRHWRIGDRPVVIGSKQALGRLPPGRACLRFFRRPNLSSGRPNNQPLDIGVCLAKSIAMTEPLESDKSGSQRKIPRTNPTQNSSGIPDIATKIREEPTNPSVVDELGSSVRHL